MATTKVITGKVRFGYVHVFEPSAAQEGGKEKYSVSVIIPKEDEKTLKAVEEAIKAALDLGLHDKFGGKPPKVYKNPLRDGDTERDDEVYAGCYFITANSDNKPSIVDRDLNPIMDRDEFYSGVYGRASLNFYPFNVNGNKGVACGLQNLQKLADGPKLAGNMSSAEEDFASAYDEDGDDLM